MLKHHKLPLENEEGLIITLSVKRKGTGYELSHYKEDKHLTSEGELVNVAKKLAGLLWESKNLKDV